MGLLGFFPTEFYPSRSSLPGRFSAPILAPSLLPLLPLLHLSPSKIPIAVLLLFRLLASRLASFSRPNFAIKLPPFLVLTGFLRSFLHMRHLVYKCSTDYTFSLHYQHSGVSIAFILAKNVPIASYPSLGW